MSVLGLGILLSHLIEVNDVELSELIIPMTHNVDIGVSIEVGQGDLILMDGHVIDVKGDVGGGLCDLHLNVDRTINGEVVRDDVGDEEDFIPIIDCKNLEFCSMLCFIT